MDTFLKEAINEARKRLHEGGIPIGSVLVHSGQVIGKGHNKRIQQSSVVLHGEMDTLENAGRQPASVYRNSVLYTTLSPCSMCSGAILLYGIPKVVIGENQTFGILTTQDALGKMTDKEVKDFKKVSKFQPREVTTSDGTKVELKMDGFSVSLVVTLKGQDSETLWTTGGENCHSLIISPDEKYVAYLCEMSGILVMKIK
jgi:tRNA(Arg) A34 adenosine deaminase TadA